MIDLEYLKWLPMKSPKMYQTLLYMSQGYEYAEIAKVRYVTYGTVKNQVLALRRKVGAKNAAHLIQMSHEAGIL